MRLRIDDERETENLLSYLRSWSDVLAERLSADEVEVGVLGSYRRETMEDEVLTRVRAWAGALSDHGVDVEVVCADRSPR